MATKNKFQAIKGTRDLLPPETELWNRVEQTVHEVFGTYGYGEIRPPIFESTELFARSIGMETDIVSKEMYSFEDHDLVDIERLRTLLVLQIPNIYEASAVRSYVDVARKFVTSVKSGLREKKIPATPDNVWASNTLEAEIDKLDGIDPQKDKDIRARSVEISLESVRQGLGALRFGDLVTLRPEATASICRAYIEHGMAQWPQPVKLYCLGPMFRRERPQKGRYRQFYQIDAEVLGGTDAPGIDAEVIEMVMKLFARLGLVGVQLEINSIGDRNCRPKYVEQLRAELEDVKDRLGADSQRRIETNPLRVLDSKLESEQAIIATLPKIGDHLCEDCKKHYQEVKRQLVLRGVGYKENWRLVRGLDYYMRTTFEITARGLGSQNAVCGGGRYDGLVELLGGSPTKGIGFAIGEDRLILSLQEAGKGGAAAARDVYIAWMGEKSHTTAITAARRLREAGFSVELPATEQKFGKALGQADRLGARFALILGEDEVTSGEWTVKTLGSGEQVKVRESALLEFLAKAKTVSS